MNRNHRFSLFVFVATLFAVNVACFALINFGWRGVGVVIGALAVVVAALVVDP